MNRRRRPGWPVVAAAAFAVAAVAGTADSGKRLEFELADIGARLLMDDIESDVVIIGIDARSLAASYSDVLANDVPASVLRRRDR